MDPKITKILLLDDDPNQRGVLSDILKLKGFEPVLAETGAAGLARIDQQDIDVALIDLKLEDMAGQEVLRGIKTRSPETECIMLTGHASQATAIEAVTLGAYSYFQKPYDVDQLLVAIQRAAEKHAAAHAILESEARFRSLIENSLDLIAILNPDATLRYVSPSIERILGYSIKDVVEGTGLQDYIHPDDLPAFVEAFHLRTQTSDFSPASIQLRLRHKDGTWRTLEGTGSNLLGHPAIEGIVINARDVTERMQAQKAMRLAEANYRLIFENASVGIFQSTPDGRFLSVNPILASIYGYDSPEDMLTSVKDMAHEIYVEPSERREFERLLAERGEVAEFICQNYRKDGSLIWASTNARLVRDAGGNILYYEGFTADITERVRAEEDLRRMVESRSIVYRASEEISASLNTEQIFAAVHHAVEQIMPCEDFVISLYDEIRNEMGGNYILENNTRVAPNPYQADHGLGGYIVHTGRSVILNNSEQIKTSGIKFEPYGRGPETTSVVAVPLQVKGKTIGILSTQSYHSDAYTAEDQELLEMLASHVAVAIDNARLYEQAQQEITDRKQAEEKLKESETRYRSLFEASPISLWEEDFSAVKHQLDVLRKRGVKDFRKYLKSHPQVVAECAHLVRLLDVNKATLELYRAGSKAELLMNLTLIFSDESYTQFREELILVADGKRQFDWEGVNQTLDSKRLDIHLSFSVEPEHEKDLSKVIISVVDVTKRKQAEEALRKSESSLQAVLQSTADGILAIGRENEVLYANKRFAEIWRIPQDVLASRDDSVLLQFVLDQLSDPQSFLKKVQELYKSNAESFDTLYFKDGRVFERLSEPLMQGAQVRGRVWSFRDITERKQAEEALKESQQSYQMLVEHIPGVIYRDALDEKASTLFIGPQIKDLTGYAPEEWLADPDMRTKLLHSDDRSRALAENRYHLATGEPLRSDYRMLRRDGRVLWVRDEAVTIRDSSGHSLYDQGVLTDITERKQAEEQVHLSEERYRMLAENMSDTVWLMDLGLRTTYISPSVIRLRGFTLDELNTIPLDQQMPPDSLQRALQLFTEILSPENLTQTDRPVSRTIELEFYKKDGTRFWSENTFTLIRDPQGQPLAILGSGRDISERRQVEEKLRDSEKYFRLLTENNTDAVVLVDPRGMVLYESPAYGRMMSRPISQRLGKSGFEFIHPEDKSSVAKMITELVQYPDEIRQGTFRVQHKDGSWHWLEATSTNLLGESAIHGLVINVHDVTERRQAEEALRQAEAKYHNIFENSIEGIFQSTPAGKFSTVNPALARMLGYASPEELIARMTDLNHKLYVQPERREEFMKHLSEHGTIVNFESEVYQRDGTTIWISENAQAMRDQFGQILYYEGTLKDITDRKRAEEQIRRRVAELEVLYESGLSISILLEPRKIAQKMIEILSQKLDWHHTAIRLYYPETRRLELLALSEPGLNPAQIQIEIDRLNKTFASPNMGLSGWVIKNGRSIRSGNVQADKRYFSAFLGINSGVYTPLMIGERAIGAIAVESQEPNRFNESDERLLQTLAAQSAIAFENARLYQEAVTAANRKAALHQGGLEIVRAGPDIEALCHALHHAARQVMPAEAFTVSLLTEDGLEVEAPYLFDRGTIHPNTHLPVTAGITGRVIGSKKPLRIKDAQKSKGAKPIMFDGMEPTRAILAVPLLAQDKVIGVISAQSWDPDVYTDEDQIFLETLASEAAVAFENARLFDEIRHRLAELESLSQVSVSLTSVIDLAPLLDNILAGARKAIPSAEKGSILLVETDNTLRLHAVSGCSDPRLINMILPDQQGYVTRVARERNPIKIDDAHAGYEVPGDGTIEEIEAVQSGIAAPLIVKGKVIGVISLDNASQKAAFTDSDLRLLVTFASSAAVAIENARLFTETQQRLHRLSALHSIDAAIGASVDIHVTLSIVLEHILSELNADAAAVLIFNPLTRMLEYAAGRGFRLHIVEGMRVRLGDGLAGQSAMQRRTINIADIHQTDSLEQVLEHPVSGSGSLPMQYLEEENFVSYHAMPLVAKGQVQGVLEIFNRTPMQVDQEWITFFEMLAGQTAIAIDNGRLFENLQHSNLELTLAYDATIQGWSQALELRDEETEGHTLRVTDLTLRLMQAMGVDETETEHARRGALLHDIGKIAIPDKILLKPGPLDDREWSVMRKHPQFAYDMLAPITYLRPALLIPWCHHEKWDGSGYPRGLKGEEIPMVARIFAIVDVYDALTSNRPYRQAWTHENALEYIRGQSGKYFDPKVVTAFMNLMTEEK